MPPEAQKGGVVSTANPDDDIVVGCEGWVQNRKLHMEDPPVSTSSGKSRQRGVRGVVMMFDDAHKNAADSFERRLDLSSLR